MFEGPWLWTALAFGKWLLFGQFQVLEVLPLFHILDKRLKFELIVLSVWTLGIRLFPENSTIQQSTVHILP